MATRSRIAIETQDGIISIYCHWDGHIETNGVILSQYYRTKDKVEELIALGDLSSLHRTIDKTVAYHRDRDEDLIQTPFSNVEELFEDGSKNGNVTIYVPTEGGMPVPTLQMNK